MLILLCCKGKFIFFFMEYRFFHEGFSMQLNVQRVCHCPETISSSKCNTIYFDARKVLCIKNLSCQVNSSPKGAEWSFMESLTHQSLTSWSLHLDQVWLQMLSLLQMTRCIRWAHVLLLLLIVEKTDFFFKWQIPLLWHSWFLQALSTTLPAKEEKSTV